MNKVFVKQLSDQAYQALCVNDLAMALDCYTRISHLDPNNHASWHFMGLLLDLQGNHKTALDMVKKAIEFYKCSANYYTTLANIYRNLNRYEEAMEAIRISCELRPYDAVSLSNAAMILTDERKYSKAKEVYEAALQLEMGNSYVHFNYSLLLLSLGEFKQGWKEYEWRFPLLYNKPIPKYPEDLKGKKIQIIPDQGYGDFIMFSRFFKNLKESGASIFINCPKALSRLYDCHYCPNPDFTIYVTSLACLCDEIPTDPYIKALGNVKINESKFKIGVASRAVKQINNDVQIIKKEEYLNILPHLSNLVYHSSLKRSLPHAFFDPLFSKNRKFYNLQIDTNCYGMENVSGSISDFADVADLVEQMDIIITIDTALAHLSGAMGKKTLLLLPYNADWRWCGGFNWYPSIEIIQQPVREDWESVQTSVARRLEQYT